MKFISKLAGYVFNQVALLALCVQCLAGGTDGTGGTLTAEKSASPDQIAAQLPISQLTLKHFFFALESRFEKATRTRYIHEIEDYEMFEKAFKPGKDNIYQIIKEIRFYFPEKNNSCPLKRGEKDKDASVVSKEKRVLCFDIAKLSLKSDLNQKNLEVKIFALLVHEVVHLIDGDEETANKYQDLAEKNFISRSVLTREANEFVNLVSTMVNRTHVEVTHLVKYVKNNQFNLACDTLTMKTSKFAGMLNTVLNMQQERLLSLFSLKEMQHISIAAMTGIVAHYGYCFSPEELSEIGMKTTSLASIYFSDFMKHENSYYSGPIFEDPIISIGEYHNGEQLLSNMNKAYKQLNLAVTSVIQSLLLQEK